MNQSFRKSISQSFSQSPSQSLSPCEPGRSFVLHLSHRETGKPDKCRRRRSGKLINHLASHLINHLVNN